MEKQMKAWYVQDKPNCIFCGIVFAETAGKAKAYCVNHEDVIGEVEFIDVSVRRLKEADKYYRGKPVMEWYDDEDRLVMVRDFGMYCDDDGFDADDCKKCSASEYCGKYQEWLEEESD